MIAAAEEDKNLSDILREFKGFTSRRIVTAIQEELESRWMLYRYSSASCYAGESSLLEVELLE